MTQQLYLEGDMDSIARVLEFAKPLVGKGITVIDTDPTHMNEEE